MRLQFALMLKNFSNNDHLEIPGSLAQLLVVICYYLCVDNKTLATHQCSKNLICGFQKFHVSSYMFFCKCEGLQVYCVDWHV